MSEISEKAAQAADHVRTRTDRQPSFGVILGSGLGSIAGSLTDRIVIPYAEIPNFPIPTVKGHEGNLVLGSLSGILAAVMQGRFHYYEGYYMRDVTFPVRVLAGLGVKALIVTNASGGIREGLMPGDIMAVNDHINLMGANPLLGLEAGSGEGERFLDLTDAYDTELIDIAAAVAGENGMPFAKGVLASVSGPCYETPAEVRMLRSLGADAVCMSSVPEVIMARYLGMRVLCLSLVTNRAAGLSDTPPGHSEVLAIAESRHESFAALVERVVAKMAKAGIV